MQLFGPDIYPFTTVKQHIFMSALFEPLQAVCNVVTADLTEVRSRSCSFIMLSLLSPFTGYFCADLSIDSVELLSERHCRLYHLFRRVCT